MTSKQAMQRGLKLLCLLLWMTLLLGHGLVGCARDQSRWAMQSPYDERRVWAVAPLRDESGSGGADGVGLADHLAAEIGKAQGLDVLPVNRTLAAMDSLDMTSVDSREDALRLLRAMKVDGLVAGTITAYDPYDPPRLGMTLELYAENILDSRTGIDPRQLTRTPTGDEAGIDPAQENGGQPVIAISGIVDGRTETTRVRLDEYIEQFGEGKDPEDSYRLYLLSMDLFSQFVSHEMGLRLIRAEAARAARARQDQPGESQPDPY